MWLAMNTSTEHVCANCLNAYQNNYTTSVLCYNKEFEAQFTPNLDCTVKAKETCGRWSTRRQDQNMLDFHKTIQLSLF